MQESSLTPGHMDLPFAGDSVTAHFYACIPVFTFQVHSCRRPSNNCGNLGPSPAVSLCASSGPYEPVQIPRSPARLRYQLEPFGNSDYQKTDCTCISPDSCSHLNTLIQSARISYSLGSSGQVQMYLPTYVRMLLGCRLIGPAYFTPIRIFRVSAKTAKGPKVLHRTSPIPLSVPGLEPRDARPTNIQLQ
jgi:hypothetical protein